MSLLFSTEEKMSHFVEVAVPVPLYRTFHYAVPQPMIAQAMPGSRVLVPFGSKLLTGVLLQTVAEPEIEVDKIKPILQVLDTEPMLIPVLIDLCRWLSEYWLAPVGECTRLFFPPGMEVSSVVKVRLTPKGNHVLFSSDKAIGEAQRKMLSTIHERGVSTVAYLRKELKTPAIYNRLSALQEKGLVALVRETETARVKEKRVKSYSLAEAGRNLLAAAEPLLEIRQEMRVRNPARQNGILQYLSEFPKAVSENVLKKETGATVAILKAMTDRGWLELRESVYHRQTWRREWHGRIEKVELTGQQQQVLASIRQAMAEGIHAPLLLHGVTGSGKTEVYVRILREVLDAGGQALVLVPEIGLTPAALHIYRAYFGDQVALLHSGLGEGERHDEWWRVRRGEANLVVGTRSAIFAPLQKLRLIIIDEEHDASYKQDESPRYHARDVAIWRAYKQNAVVVLGSATPAVESYYRATVTGKWRCLVMDKRVQDRPLAGVEVVDMQEEFLRHGPNHILSDPLKDSLKECLENGQQALVLLNRRGFSPVFLCRSCGFVLHCDHCSSPMTFHQMERMMLCHHCRRFKQVPSLCPQCKGKYIYYVGEGTEKVQSMLQQLFPDYTVDRMDADTVAGKHGYFRILNGLLKGETDILVGTQMIAKGHDFPKVTLAAVVAADRALSVPDFRSAERTFQLLTQVAGRSGRGEIKGKVVIQTRYPNHYSLRCACRQDYAAFFREEIEYRRALGYPPFSFLAALLFREETLERVKKFSADAGHVLQKVHGEMKLERRVRILGPNPSVLEKVKSQYRYQILIKAQSRKELIQFLRKGYEEWKREGLNPSRIAIDVDPQSML